MKKVLVRTMVTVVAFLFVGCGANESSSLNQIADEDNSTSVNSDLKEETLLYADQTIVYAEKFEKIHSDLRGYYESTKSFLQGMTKIAEVKEDYERAIEVIDLSIVNMPKKNEVYSLDNLTREVNLLKQKLAQSTLSEKELKVERDRFLETYELLNSRTNRIEDHSEYERDSCSNDLTLLADIASENERQMIERYLAQ